jgi:transposase
MSQLQLTSYQRRRLRRQLAEARDARLYRRTLAVLEFDRGQSAADVAATLRVSRQSVYNWAGAYALARDPAALADADRPGRPPLLAGGADDLLRRLLGRSPQGLGYPATTWTVPLLQEQIQRETGRRPSDDTVRRKLRRLDHVWKRPRYVLDPGAEPRGKKEAHPPPDQAAAAAQRGPGRRRDRPAAVPAVARVLVAAGPAQAGDPVRPQRPAGGVRGNEPAHRVASVLAARAPAGR